MPRLSLYISITILSIFLNLFSQNNTDDKTEENSLTLLFTGDVMGHDSQIRSACLKQTKNAQYEKEFDYTPVFKHIKPILSKPDFTIANLEVTLAGPPYKGYPAFSSPDALAHALKDAGVDALVNANNHCCDRGGRGLKRTLKIVDQLKFKRLGSYYNQADRDSINPMILEKNGIRVAILNYTYGTNGIKTPKNTIVDRINQAQIKKDLEKASLMNVDKKIVVMHWGYEYQSLPHKNQVQLYNFCKKNGADYIIGSHPHVIQPMHYDKTDDKLVVYSLGNFISNQRKPKTDGGAVFELTLSKNDGVTKISKAGYRLTWVYTPVIDGRKHFYILPTAEFEVKPNFFISKWHYNKMKKFITDSRKLLIKNNKNIPEIIGN